MKKVYEEHYINAEKLEELEENNMHDNLYVVFEEYHGQSYDIIQGVFDDLDIAIEYAKEICYYNKEDLFVANYKDYINGNYDYLYELKKGR